MAKKYNSYINYIEGKVIFLDTETTGFNSEEPTYEEVKKGKIKDRIVEIAGVEVVDGIKGESFHKYVNPERHIPEDATGIHGITDEDIESEYKFYQIAEKFLDFVSGSTLVIHNAPFDVGFINMELEHAGRKLDKDFGKIEDYCKIIDSLEKARKLNPCNKKNLDALSKNFNIDSTKRDYHGALVDSIILADVYGALIDYERNHYSGPIEKPYEEEIIIKPLRLDKRPRTNLSL